MHLGRFHAVINDLSVHFKNSLIVDKLTTAATYIEQYAANRDPNTLQNFKDALAAALDSCRIEDANLEQPYGRQVIKELKLEIFMGARLSDTINQIVSEQSYDAVGLAAKLSTLKNDIEKKVSYINAIDDGFEKLDVEFERVYDGDAEIGFLLPREAIGDTIQCLTKEFDAINQLCRAINELTGASEYDPTIKTISSSAWQLFVHLDPVAISAFVIGIERIVAMIKANLEIKKLQKELAKHDADGVISNDVEKLIQKNIDEGISKTATEIRIKFGDSEKVERNNELEISIRRGLVHLAKRINQGAEVEINVSVPNDMDETQASESSQELGLEVKAAIEQHREKIKMLREIRSQAINASAQTLNVGNIDSLKLEFSDPDKELEKL